MASEIENAQQKPNANQKTLHVWSKPIEQSDSQDDDGEKNHSSRPTVGEAVGLIRTDDFTNVHNTPCARQGFLAGIVTGAGVGGLNFVLKGKPIRAANWAAGMFLLGSTASYEYCQYLRRAERLQMKRNIEIVAENRREQGSKFIENNKEKLRQDHERTAPNKPWYRLW